MANRLAQKPDNTQIAKDREPDGQGERTKGAKEMRRAPPIAQQEHDREQVHQPAEETASAEFGVAEAASVVFDRNLADAEALPMREHGHEALKFAVHTHVP